jgi:hypothetical protein
MPNEKKTLAPRRKAPKFIHRTCACGTRFVTQNPRHDTCRACMRERRRAEERRAEPVRQREELRECLRTALEAGTLPASARVTQSGRQVVVVWMGRSYTFYLPKAA